MRRTTDPDTSDVRRAVLVHLPWATIGKVAAALALLWIAVRLAPLVLVVLVSVILAIALEPLVAWLERRRIPRWIGAAATCLAIVATAAVFVMLVWSSLVDQGRLFADRLLALERQVQERAPAIAAALQNAAGKPDASALGRVGAALARDLVRAAIVAVLSLIVTVYLLIDGRRTFEWVRAFVPRAHRDRVHETASAARTAVLGYVIGNVATSVFAAVVTGVALGLLHVPAALLLALLAGIFDFVPVLGFIASAVPAVAFALTVSTTTGLIVLLIYVLYHLVENYVIAPRVYGDRLRLSHLAVLLAFAAGAQLGGIVGALIALPVAATYPAVERIWLAGTLGRDVVEEHEAIAEQPEGDAGR